MSFLRDVLYGMRLVRRSAIKDRNRARGTESDAIGTSKTVWDRHHHLRGRQIESQHARSRGLFGDGELLENNPFGEPSSLSSWGAPFFPFAAPLATVDIPHMCIQEGHDVIAVTLAGDHRIFRLRRG